MVSACIWHDLPLLLRYDGATAHLSAPGGAGNQEGSTGRNRIHTHWNSQSRRRWLRVGKRNNPNRWTKGRRQPECPASPSHHVQPLDTFDFLRLQAEIDDGEILTHVVGVGRARQGNHADIEGEPEDDLANRPTVTAGDAD